MLFLQSALLLTTVLHLAVGPTVNLAPLTSLKRLIARIIMACFKINGSVITCRCFSSFREMVWELLNLCNAGFNNIMYVLVDPRYRARWCIITILVSSILEWFDCQCWTYSLWLFLQIYMHQYSHVRWWHSFAASVGNSSTRCLAPMSKWITLFRPVSK